MTSSDRLTCPGLLALGAILVGWCGGGFWLAALIVPLALVWLARSGELSQISQAWETRQGAVMNSVAVLMLAALLAGLAFVLLALGWGLGGITGALPLAPWLGLLPATGAAVVRFAS